MRRGRFKTGLVLGAFGAALTVLPWLHTLHHRDDHVHVDGAIVYLDDHDHGDHEEEEDDSGPPGFDHPAHHGPHGRGALAHGSAFIVAGAVFLFPAPALALEQAPERASPDQPSLAEQHWPRVTRGPPLAASSQS